MSTRETTSHNSRFQTLARKQLLHTSCSHPLQFQSESCQTVDSFQHPSVNQSRLSGRRVRTQILSSLRIQCSLSRLCHSLHKWTSKNSANNWRTFSTPTTSTFCSAPIIFLPRFNKTCLIQTRCRPCNRDRCNSCSNSSKNHLVAQEANSK